MFYGRIMGVVAVLVVGMAFVGGCGEDGEASANVTKAEFIKEAEAVCNERKKEWEAEIAAFNKKTEEIGSYKGEEERAQTLFEEFILPSLETELDALESLEVPEGDDEEVEKMLQSRSSGIEALEDEGKKAVLRKPFRTFEKEAKAYGLNCAPLI